MSQLLRIGDVAVKCENIIHFGRKPSIVDEEHPADPARAFTLVIHMQYAPAIFLSGTKDEIDSVFDFLLANTVSTENPQEEQMGRQKQGHIDEPVPKVAYDAALAERDEERQRVTALIQVNKSLREQVGTLKKQVEELLAPPPAGQGMDKAQMDVPKNSGPLPTGNSPK